MTNDKVIGWRSAEFKTFIEASVEVVELYIWVDMATRPQTISIRYLRYHDERKLLLL